MQILKNAPLLTLLLIPSLWIKAIEAPPVMLTRGMVITSSVQIQKADYKLAGYDSLNRPVITIKGDNITVDFNDAFLQGNIESQLPNEFYGLAVLIKGNNITIKNANIRGYKVAIMADGCKNLKIENSDFSYNYRQQLQSTWLHEDVSDWMSYHHNEHDEWLRYGAGIYLKDCDNAAITNNTITGGQCALMMVRCNDGTVTDNDFSFNSGIGIGMYRSSRNSIIHNKLDFNVRGHSFGFYNRGQDSAGILVFEQCDDNIFAYNSVTHSGDGFFLWAGQTTMDSGEGGCNNNYIYKNNFSFAPTNGIEVTFSKNNIIFNIIKECDNGIWGGYSWKTNIYNNIFYKNKTAIAIEHGQDNTISGNNFEANTEDGIKLWARKSQPSDWGYANKRITGSMGYLIRNNIFQDEKTAINAVLTDTLVIDKNEFSNCRKDIKTDSTVSNLSRNGEGLLDPVIPIPGIILDKWNLTQIPVGNFPKGRDQMKITEWGPYDFRYPVLFLKKIDSNHVYYFDVLGPKGSWKIKNFKDVKNIDRMDGIFPSQITAQQDGADFQLELEYTGEAFSDQFGNKHAADKGYSFSFRDFQPDINWDVKWYSWDKNHDPNKNYDLFKTVYNNKPVKTEQAKQLDYTWWGTIGKNLPADSFAVVATGNIDVPEGSYTLSVTADDLVKVFVDGKPVIDFWDVSKYKNDEDAHHQAIVKLNGKHKVRIEMVENSGYATLIFKIKPLTGKL